MTLQEELEHAWKEIEAGTSAAHLQTIREAGEQLKQEFFHRNSLSVRDTAPDFRLPRADGRMVRLYDRLVEGPVILTFYRGGWCPFCRRELRAYQRRLPMLEAAGAQLLAISPQTPKSSLFTVENNNLHFDVLSDEGSCVAEKYGLAYELSDSLKALYTEYGHPLPDTNGTGDWLLPVPATFVVDMQGTIQLAYIETDYRRRLEPDDAIAVVRALNSTPTPS